MADLPEKVEFLFGNMIALTSICEGCFSVISVVVPIVMRINPESVGPDAKAISIKTVCINAVIMFLMETLVSDLFVAKYAQRVHARYPGRTVNLLKVWENRSSFSYIFFIVIMLSHALTVSLNMTRSMCIYNQGQNAILTGCPES